MYWFDLNDGDTKVDAISWVNQIVGWLFRQDNLVIWTNASSMTSVYKWSMDNAEQIAIEIEVNVNRN